jgi:hypothetical protein
MSAFLLGVGLGRERWRAEGYAQHVAEEGERLQRMRVLAMSPFIEGEVAK